MDWHLSDEQIEELLRRMVFSAEQSAGASEEVLDHLERCDVCAPRLREQLEMIERLTLLKFHLHGPHKEGCPPDEVWEEIACGLVVEMSDQYVSHAAICDHCGPMLNRAMADLASDLSSDEESTIARLRTADPAWQRRFAGKIATESDCTPEKLTRDLWTIIWRPRVVWPVAGLIALSIGITALILVRNRPSDLDRTNKLIGEAYASQRTLPFRIAGASYSPLRLNRGMSSPQNELSLPLLRAETEIATHLTSGNNDKAWLLVSAKAKLLEGDYDRAVHILETNSDEASNPPDVDGTLAAAYFERWQQQHSPDDLGNAREAIGRALDKEPKNPVTLFNLALIDEGIALYSVAQGDWEQYLSVDSTSPWANEAREHLANCQHMIMKKQKATDGRFLFNPESLGALGPLRVSDEAIDAKIEAYQLSVFTSYYPVLVNQNGSTRGIQERAIRRVAAISANNHRDHLLMDMVLATMSAHFRESIKDLASAIAANRTGNEQSALDYARAAEKGFLIDNNRAGSLRALFEEIYALQFISRTQECLSKAEQLRSDAARAGYSWLKAEAEIEAGFCSTMNGNLSRASESLTRAGRDAADAHYEAVLDRVLVGEAGLEWQAGSTAKAWEITLHGLRHFWSSSVPFERGESFCDFLDEMAEQKRQWHLQSAVLTESVSLLGREEDRLEEAQVLVRLADSQMMVGRAVEAQSILKRALDAFRSAPETLATHNQELMVRINLAKAEAANHDYSSSASELEELRPRLGLLHDDLSLIEFYTTLGEAYRKLGDQSRAEASDLSAIGIFNVGLSTLNHERDRVTWHRHIASAYRSLVQLRIDQNKITDALRAWEEYRGAMKHPVRNSVDANRDQRAEPDLAGLQTVLVFANLPDGPFGWATSGQGVKGIRLNISNQDLVRIGTRFAEQCASPSSDIASLKVDGNRLYQTLILPFADSLSNVEAVLIEPDEELARIPFNALVDESGNYLNASHTIAISPFAATRDRSILQANPIDTRDSALLVESRSALDGSQAEDVESDVEIQRVASYFPNNEIVQPSSGVRAAFLHSLRRAALFHYAGHSASSSNGGALLLSDKYLSGGQHSFVLSSDDLAGVRSHGKLAVLSACETDHGQGDRWLDRDNIALTLLTLGFREVVASRWNVDSSSSTALMQAFYADLASGMSVARSLRSAEERVRNMRGYQHPFFWAAFSVQERPQS